MEDRDKKKRQLIEELTEIRRRLSLLEDSETGRTRADKLLKENEEVLRALMNATHESLVLIDREGTILLSNTIGAERLGKSTREIIGTCLYDHFPPDLAKSRKEQWDKVFDFGEPVYFQDSRSGRFFDLYCYPVFAEEGGVSRAAIFGHEITERKQAEELFRKEQETLVSILEKAPYGIIVNDPGGKFVVINPEASRITGYTLEDIPTGKVWFKKAYPDPDYRTMVIETWKRDVSKKTVDRAFTVCCKDGTIKELEFRSTLLPDGKGITMFSDITDKKRAVEALRQAEEKYRTIFENAVMGIYQSTPDGRYIAVNQAFARIYGYDSPQEMIETVTDIGRQSYVNAEDRAGLVALLEKHGVVEKFEVQAYRKDKSTVWVSINARGVKDPEGNIMYLEGTIEDITERKHAEKALQESEGKYRSVVESSFVGFYIVQDDVYRFANEGFCEITGYSCDELIDKVNPLDITYSEDRALVESNPRKRVTGEAGHIEYVFRTVRKNGQVRYVKVFGTSLMYNGRRAAAGTIIDVTREKDLEQQLLRTQKLEAIGTLAGGIAHDFNNILISIMGFTEMVQDDIAPESREYHRLGLVLKGAHRGRDLVKQILTFSRQAEYEQKPVALSAIVEEGLKLLRPLLPVTTDIRSKGLAGGDTILADPAQIHQVLMNLCNNGVQAMGRKGGVLEISITRDFFEKGDHVPILGMKPGEYVALTVRDTGSGMKPEVLDRIFDPFFTTKSQGEGTGLGLSVVHGIVKSHGGFIKVESEPGKGSIFHVYFPKTERQEDPTAGEETPAEGGKECILFVDDEDLAVELNSERLTHLGYEVVATTSSLEALEIFKKEPQKFHLVITDYTMPHMTGVDLARKLVKIRDDIPIILCTGYNDSISPDKAKRAGIRECLLKPQSNRELDAAIRRVLTAKTA